jgi:ribose transport system substrate-binding protein
MLFLLVFCLAFAFTGCGGGGSSSSDSGGDAASSDTGEASGDKIVVGFSHFNVGGNNYCTTYDNEIKAYWQATYPDIELISLDAKGDAAVQLDQISDLISQKVDVAIVWPVSGTTVISGLEEFAGAGIPVINTNSAVDEAGQDLLVAFSGPSDFIQGQQAGQAMVEALGGKGNVVELAGTAGYDTSILRSEGFADAIQGTDIVLLETQPTDWSTDKAQTIMQTYITKYGDEIDGIYCADDGISMGAMNALEAVGLNDGSIPITSCTMFASGYDAIKDGKQYASILQSPLLDARLALDLAVQVARGEDIEFDNRIETFIVTQENADEFDRPVW